MTEEELGIYVRSALGSPAVRVEVEDSQLSAFVKAAISKVQPYLFQTNYMTLTATNNVLDLSGKKVYVVVRIFSAENIVSAASSSFDEFAFRTQGGDYTALAASITQRAELEALLDIGFKHIGDKVYLDNFPPNVTIEYIPRMEELEDVVEDWAVNWIRDWVMATVKIAVGSVRKKYTLNDSPVTMDGDTLSSDGAMERDRLEDSLNSRGFIFMIR